MKRGRSANPTTSKKARVEHVSAASTTTAATMSTTTTTTTTTTSNCPYLDTVRREVLDFDVPHICKTTLSDQNVYACLVCGQFFRGRGEKSPAFIHAVNESHFVYLKLDTRRAYCLPDGYEIQARHGTPPAARIHHAGNYPNLCRTIL